MRLRTLVSKSFTPRWLERMRRQIRIIVNYLLDEIPSETVEITSGFASDLPVVRDQKAKQALRSDDGAAVQLSLTGRRTRLGRLRQACRS